MTKKKTKRKYVRKPKAPPAPPMAPEPEATEIPPPAPPAPEVPTVHIEEQFFMTGALHKLTMTVLPQGPEKVVYESGNNTVMVDGNALRRGQIDAWLHDGTLSDGPLFTYEQIKV